METSAATRANKILTLAREVLNTEAKAIADLPDRLGAEFVAAVELILSCPGRVVVSGIGKSGHVARKIASTMASTGTPAFFVHPAEASHGDLGMITHHDIVIALSYSGESAELLAIVPHIKRQGAKLIVISGSEHSSLAQIADIHLEAQVDSEACPLGLAPTASTTAALALGDALALALLDARGFSAEDFARSHPGGALGRKLLTHVSDVMRTGKALPTVPASATLAEAIVEISSKVMGMTVVVHPDSRVAGIFTDGDLRRCIGKVKDFSAEPVVNHMNRSPRTIGAQQLAIDAAVLMENHKINQLLVLDAEQCLIGALSMRDLLMAKVI